MTPITSFPNKDSGKHFAQFGDKVTVNVTNVNYM